MENYDYILTSNGELYHYGVKGMKWGHRKARQYSNDAKAYRQSAKEWAEIGANKAAKARAKGNEKKAAKIEKKYKDYEKADLDEAKRHDEFAAKETRKANFQKAQADIGKSRKLGHKLATNVLAGPFANRTYNSVLAAGGSRVAAAGITYATGLIGGPIGHIAVAHLYTNSAGDGTTRKRY